MANPGADAVSFFASEQSYTAVIPFAVCDVCQLDVYLPGLTRHPCCDLADKRGETSCQGCETFRKRWERGETCPHVVGATFTGRSARPVPVKACCQPTERRWL